MFGCFGADRKGRETCEGKKNQSHVVAGASSEIETLSDYYHITTIFDQAINMSQLSFGRGIDLRTALG